MVNKELEYRKELAVYYMSTIKNWIDSKRNVIPVWGQIAIVLVIILVVFNGFKMLISTSEEAATPKQNTIGDVKNVTMPQLFKMNKLDAQKKLADLGFSNVQIESSTEYGDANGEQIILKQTPVAGKSLKSNDVVTITYGSKEKFDDANTQSIMPNLNGMTLTEALKKLRELGFDNIKWVVPKGYDRDQVIITDQSPKADENTPLSTEVSLNVSPGFVFEDVKTKLEQEFLPYGNFSKIENLKDRDIKMTLAKKDNKLTNAKALNDAARSYKITIEHILNSTIGDVMLINPGVNLVGESQKAEVKNTKAGLTLAGAEAACSSKADETLDNFEIDWPTSIVQQKITDNDITISGNGTIEDSDDHTASVVVYCVVSGTDVNPVIKNFSSN